MKSETSAPGGQSATQDPPVFDGAEDGTGFWHHLSRTASLALPVMVSRAGMVLMLTVDTAIVGHLAFAERGLAALWRGAHPDRRPADRRHRPADRRHRALGPVRRRRQAGSLRRGLAPGPDPRAHARRHLCGDPGQRPRHPGAARPAGRRWRRAAAPVLRAMGWGMPGILVFIACAHFLEGISRPVAPMLLMFVGNIAERGPGLCPRRRRLRVCRRPAWWAWRPRPRWSAGGSASAPCCWCC